MDEHTIRLSALNQAITSFEGNVSNEMLLERAEAFYIFIKGDGKGDE